MIVKSMLTQISIKRKINSTPKGFYLPILKLHSILTVANLVAHNNLGSCYYGQPGQVNLVRVR